jgi:hypothetical protein
MDIKKYIKIKQHDGNQSHKLENGDSVKIEFGRYSKMSHEQLMQEMFSIASKSRLLGEMDNSKLDAFYENSKSFLTSEQAERMRELIMELKK